MNSALPIVARLRGRYQRELACRFGRRTATLSLAQPIVSFTFDDFPRSALAQGGAILSAHGFHGTYFVSLGLMGQMAPAGEMFSREDLFELAQQGHELGCHTYHHCHSWDTAPSSFESSILRNQQAIAELSPGRRFCTFSYPISGPRPRTKHNVAKYYGCARGGGQTYNAGDTDLNFLKAFFIEQNREDLDAIKAMIDANAKANGWLIFATHDVCASPTRFGCTPALFKQIVDHTVQSGAAVLPVDQALKLASPRS